MTQRRLLRQNMEDRDGRRGDSHLMLTTVDSLVDIHEKPEKHAEAERDSWI